MRTREPGDGRRSGLHAGRRHRSGAVGALADELDRSRRGRPRGPARRRRGRRRRARGPLAFGPGRGARLEGSKAWMKDVLREAGVPTARLPRRSTPGREAAALAFLETMPGLYVMKTDGLAAGKGVIVTDRSPRRGTPCAPTCRGPRSATPAARGDRRGPERARDVAARAVRRSRRRAAGAGPGLQAARRRRRGPEHRGDGRVLARARSRSPTWSTR